MTKKVLFIITQSEFGGAQRFLSNLVMVLDKNKYDILVAAGRDGDDKNGLLKFLEDRGINTRHLRHLRRGVNPLFDFGLGLIEIYRLIKREKPDILFLLSSKAGVLGSLAGRLAQVSKIIYRIGGWAFNDPRPWWENFFYKFIEKISAHWKDIIIVNAECLKKQAIELGIKPKKEILTVYNGIDVKNLEFLPKEEARNRLKLSSQQLVAGTIANFYPAKGLANLIEAANLINNKNINFIIIGEGQEREKLENLIKKYNLENKFFLVGAVPEAYKYLKAFDVFVLPSVKEGFPWVILEAMTAEIPIVATKVGAVPEIIENNKTGFLVESARPEELAEAIKRLVENETLRKNFSKEARKIVEEKFSLAQMVGEIEKLL